MKTIFLVFAIAFSALQVSAQSVTEQIRVYGNCGMCKERIETALDIKGVQFAKWDPKTGILQVKYNQNKISRDEIEKAINKAGHDTEHRKADDKVYQQLHHCCKYDRKHED